MPPPPLPGPSAWLASSSPGKGKQKADSFGDKDGDKSGNKGEDANTDEDADEDGGEDYEDDPSYKDKSDLTAQNIVQQVR